MTSAKAIPIRPPARGYGSAIAMGVCTLVLIGVLSVVGQGGQATGGAAAAAGVLSAVAVLLNAGLFALAYVLGAIGLGRLPAALFARGLESRVWIQVALGVGMMLWISHLLGCFGLLSGEGLTPRLVAWGVVGLGIVLLGDQLLRGELAPEKWPALPWLGVFAAPAVAVLAVAAANPPGWLWGSEFGAYDVLGYHLQLPKEWALSGIAPSEHNVYSYLPSYLEAGYLHLGQMMIGGDVGVVERLLGGDGVWVYACQALHALVGVLAGLVCGRGAWAAAVRCGAGGSVARLAGVCATSITLSTGWTIVCGSLAYNEMGVVLLAAGAMLMCVDREVGERGSGRGVRLLRSAGVGLLVGIASSCKPTALFLVGPAAGVLLLASMHARPAREWVGAIAAGSIGGLVAMLPWMIRNVIASGNPVFPFAAETLGLGHWTVEQVARHARAHSFDGSVWARVGLLFSDRGWLHGQWGATPWLAVAAAVVGLREPRTRSLAMLLVGGLAAGILAWLFVTHLQSRFLVPLLAPMTMLLGAGIAAAMRGDLSRVSTGARVRAGLLAYAMMVVLLVLPWLCVMGFLRERGGAPNGLLVGGVAEFTGMLRADTTYAELSVQDRATTLLGGAGPIELVNLAVRPALLGAETRDVMLAVAGEMLPGEPGAVYLLGDGTPLYYLGATGEAGAGVVYHTTWDVSPLGEAIRGAAGEHAAWTGALRGRGIGFVLINFDELLRLSSRDGYFDPDVTEESVRRWLEDPESRCTVIKAWPIESGSGVRPGRMLLRLGAPADKGER